MTATSTTTTDEREPRLTAQLAPLIDNAMREVDDMARGLVALGAAARTGLGVWLRERLAIGTRAVLEAWSRQRDDAGRALGADEWSRIFSRHPDLVPIVEGLIGVWRAGVRQFLTRYAEDAPHLGESTVGLTQVEVVGGGWKKSPTLRLTTDGGRTYFYKDHTLEIGAWLMELVGRINESGLPIPLHVRRIFARPGGYGWDEAVARAPCESAEAVERYFVRVGMWIRLLQILAANDLHSKNLIAAGEHPVPIDHENLLQPTRAVGRTALDAVGRAIQRSPLEVGLLPHLFAGEPGRRAVNSGGLEAGGDYLLPFLTPDGYPPIQLPRTLPTLGGEVVSARAHGGAIITGYQAMHEVITGPGEQVFEQMLMRASACEVRVLSRPAHETRRLLVESLQPELLARPGARARMLAQRAHPDDRRALLELEDPRHYELPMLAVVARDRSAAEQAWDRAVITTALACADARKGSAPGTLAEVAPVGDNELVRHAVALGDLVLAEAHGDPDALHWLGVCWSPLSASRALGTLPNDLLSGNAGLAVVLAALARVTHEARFADGARRALAPVTKALAAPTPATPKNAWRPWGAYLGSAAQLYAVERVAELLGKPPPRRAPRLFEALLAARSGGVDLATGTAGMVAVMARRAEDRPAWLPALGDVLRKALAAGLPPLPYPDGELPDYLPDARSGVRFALARLEGRAAAPADDPGRQDVGDAALLVARYLATGTWFPGSGLADRLNLGGMLGVGAVALTLLRAAFPDGAIPSLWRLD